MAEREYRRKKCGALKKNGERCDKWAINGRERCRNHGGKSHPGGPTHPTYQHGRYSSVLPAGVRALYHAAVSAPDLLSQTSEVAFLEAQIKEEMQSIGDVGETLRAWKEARNLYREWSKALSRTGRAQQAGNAAAVEQHSREAQEFSERLGAVLESGADARERRNELGKLIEAKRKVTESERERQVQASLLIPYAQVVVIFDTILQAITNEVTDAPTLARITSGLAGVIGRPHLAAIGASRPGSAGG